MEFSTFGQLSPSNDQTLLTCRDGSRPSILLAEDSPPARILTAALLSRMGCDVDTAEHGEEALEQAHQNRYDLIILDIEMPVMDGITAATLIKTATESNLDSPIIALSAFLADIRRNANWGSAFNAALSKPAGREDLRNAVHNVLRHGQLEDPSLNDVSASDDENQGLIDDQIFNEVRNSLSRQDWNALMECAEREFSDLAAEMEQAVSDDRRDTVSNLAHRIFGIAGSLGASGLQKQTRLLEHSAGEIGMVQLKQDVRAVYDGIFNTINYMKELQNESCS